MDEGDVDMKPAPGVQQAGRGGEEKINKKIKAAQRVAKKARKETREWAEKVKILERRVEEVEEKKEGKRDEDNVLFKEYRINAGEAGVLCPTSDFPGSGICKKASSGFRWKRLSGFLKHVLAVRNYQVLTCIKENVI